MPITQLPQFVEYICNKIIFVVKLTEQNRISFEINDQNKTVYIYDEEDLVIEGITPAKLYKSIYYQYINDDKNPLNLISFDEHHIYLQFTYHGCPNKRIVFNKRNKQQVALEKGHDSNSKIDEEYIEKLLLKILHKSQFIEQIQVIVLTKVQEYLDQYRKKKLEQEQRKIQNTAQNILSYLKKSSLHQYFFSRVEQAIKVAQNKLLESFIKCQIQLKLNNSLAQKNLSTLDSNIRQILLKYQEFQENHKGVNSELFEKLQWQVLELQKCMSEWRQELQYYQKKKKPKNFLLKNVEKKVQLQSLYYDEHLKSIPSLEITHNTYSPPINRKQKNQDSVFPGKHVQWL